MENWQGLAVAAGYLTVSSLIAFFWKWFCAPWKFMLPILFSVTLFSAGFMMRLAERKAIVDIGFFFTDIGSLLMTALFTVALLLGQVKYWEIGEDEH